jgi:transposase-like protein
MNKNRLAENDDVSQEFMIGVAHAISEVDMSIGNPIIYLINKGIWKVRSYFRQQVFGNTKQTCLDCGHTCRPTKTLKKHDVVIKKFTEWVCPKCHSHRVDVVQITGSEVKDDNVFATRTEQLVEEMVMDGMSIQEFRAKLSGRVLQLFDTINNGVDRDNSVSYQREIADEWGVSTACVSQYLKRLRKSWCEHYTEEIQSVIDRRIN